MKFNFLLDDRKIREFIEDGKPCRAEIIIEYYLACRGRNELPPEKISVFIDNFLAGIVAARHSGFRPDYDDMLGFTYKNGRQPKSTRKRLAEAITIGVAVIDHMEQGNTYETSIAFISQKHGMSVESVQKAYAEYKKNIAPDGFDVNGPFDNEC